MIINILTKQHEKYGNSKCRCTNVTDLTGEPYAPVTARWPIADFRSKRLSFFKDKFALLYLSIVSLSRQSNAIFCRWTTSVKLTSVRRLPIYLQILALIKFCSIGRDFEEPALVLPWPRRRQTNRVAWCTMWWKTLVYAVTKKKKEAYCDSLILACLLLLLTYLLTF